MNPFRQSAPPPPSSPPPSSPRPRLGLGFHRRRHLDLFPHGDVRVHIALSHDHTRHRRWRHHPLKRPPRRTRSRTRHRTHRRRHRARLGGRVVVRPTRAANRPRRRYRRYRRVIVIVTVRARDARARPRRSPRTNRASRLAAHPSRHRARAMRRPRAHRRRRDRHDVANTNAGATVRAFTRAPLASSRVASSRATTGGIRDDWLIDDSRVSREINTFTLFTHTHTRWNLKRHTRRVTTGREWVLSRTTPTPPPDGTMASRPSSRPSSPPPVRTPARVVSRRGRVDASSR